jgi:hypothetical protein
MSAVFEIDFKVPAITFRVCAGVVRVVIDPIVWIDHNFSSPSSIRRFQKLSFGRAVKYIDTVMPSWAAFMLTAIVSVRLVGNGSEGEFSATEIVHPSIQTDLDILALTGLRRQ